MKDICEGLLEQLVSGEALSTDQASHLGQCARCQARAGLVRNLEGRHRDSRRPREREPQLASFRQADRRRLRQGLGLLLLLGFGVAGLYASQPVAPPVDIFAALDEGFAGSYQDSRADSPPGTELLPYFESPALPLELRGSPDFLPDWSL